MGEMVNRGRRFRSGPRASVGGQRRIIARGCGSTVNLSDIVCGIEGELRRLVGDNIYMEFVPACDLGLVAADPDEMEQMVMNLVASAKEAMPRGGRLTTALANVFFLQETGEQDAGSACGTYVALAVSDSGRAPSEDAWSGPLTRGTAEEAGIRQSSPHMSLVQEIARRNHWRVVICADAGRGTTITVYLPWAQQPGADAGACEAPAEADP